MTQYDKLLQEMTIDKMTCLLRNTEGTDCCEYCVFKDDVCNNDCYRGIRLFLESEVQENDDRV